MTLAMSSLRRAASSRVVSCAARLEPRHMKGVPTWAQSQPITGQWRTSSLAMKVAGAVALKAKISRQDNRLAPPRTRQADEEPYQQ